MNHIDKLKSKLDSVKTTERILPSHEIEQKYIDKIYKLDLSSEIDSNSIVNLIFKYKEQYPISNKSSLKTWHSEYHTHKKTSDFDTLIHVIENKLKLIDDTRDQFVNTVFESWVAIYKRSEYAGWHNHSDNRFRWSVVYYAKAEENCAPIVFKDLEIVPKTNMLLVFPSRAYHMVRKSQSDIERIIFSANLDILPVDILPECKNKMYP